MTKKAPRPLIVVCRPQLKEQIRRLVIKHAPRPASPKGR